MISTFFFNRIHIDNYSKSPHNAYSQPKQLSSKTKFSVCDKRSVYYAVSNKRLLILLRHNILTNQNVNKEDNYK